MILHRKTDVKSRSLFSVSIPDTKNHGRNQKLLFDPHSGVNIGVGYIGKQVDQNK